MMRKILIGTLVYFCTLSVSYAETDMTFEEIMGTFTEAVDERFTNGRIEELDLSARTATIGGFRYHFGPSTLSTPLQVRLLGRDFGSVQLLSVGMDVEVNYFESPSEHRIATRLVQIEEAEQH